MAGSRVTRAVTSTLASPLSPKGSDSQNSDLREANGRPGRPPTQGQGPQNPKPHHTPSVFIITHGLTYKRGRNRNLCR